MATATQLCQPPNHAGIPSGSILGDGSSPVFSFYEHSPQPDGTFENSFDIFKGAHLSQANNSWGRLLLNIHYSSSF